MNEDKNFLDSRTIMAIVLVAVIWLGWQMHLAKKYPDQSKTNSEETPVLAQMPPTSPPTTTAPSPTKATTSPTTKEKLPTIQEDKVINYEDETWSFYVSAKGMALKNIHLKKYTDRTGKLIVLANEVPEGDFETTLIGSNEPLYFDLKADGNKITGIATIGTMKIQKEFIVNSAQYDLITRVSIEGIGPGVQGVSFNLVDRVAEPESGGFLVPATDHDSIYIAHGTTSKHENLSHTGEGKIGETYSNVSVASLGALYFAKAIVDNSDVQPQVDAEYLKNPEGVLARTKVNYLFPTGTSSLVLNMKTFAGPKDLNLLKSIDPKLEGIVDYWVLSVIAKPMLNLMKWLHAVFGNWGVAIILLTLIVRTLVLPLYMASFKSTKAMQRIQPHMKTIREKHKDNPQVMNAEVMKLFKENKVNPLGGCLPMLLQFPIFIALYRVLSQSIELYQAPFIFWIHDLSVKDPYYVVPVLMGIAMFLQQKITPMTTADPAQQKVLMFMPILFSFMMLSLPSGLTLYILVSTLFGIAQQLVFLKDRSNKLIDVKA